MNFILVFSLVASAFAMDWQGHRGARGLYPENTIGAMEEALKYPVSTLELDVVVSKDHKVIVSHEPWMNEEICLDPKGAPVKGKEHNIYKLNFEEIIKYDCGSKPHPRFEKQKKIATGKPTLEKLFEIIEPQLEKLRRKNVQYNIEIKSTPEDEKDGFQPDVKTFADLVIMTIRKSLPDDRFTIQSFDWRVLQYIHKTYPEIRLVALLEGKINPEDVIQKLGFKPYVFSPYFKDLKPEHVEAFHKMGVKVVTWTVNEIQDMKRMMDMKVDGIITDYPNLISDAADTCKEGFHLFRGNCVLVPKNATRSDEIPGWNCLPGYTQKRSKCVKMVIPANAFLSPDGKSWECRDGYKRYRGTCRK